MIRQSDLLIKSTVEIVIKEMRDNPWLLDDVFEDCLTDPFLAPLYSKEVENAKQWLKNNNIPVLMKLRPDTQDFPCVTISLGGDVEDESKSTLGDQSTMAADLTPSQISKPIGYIIKPFIPVSFDAETGILEVPAETNIEFVGPGMKVVNPETGETNEILSFGGVNGVIVANPETLSASRVGILPKNMNYKARVEASFFKQTFTVACHVADDPATLIWLHSIILYGLLRYREFFSSRCYSLSSLSSSDLVRNSAFAPGGDNVFSRYITLTGYTQHTWIKSPKRYIEGAGLAENGLKALSNVETDTEVADPTGDGWDTVLEKQSSTRRTYSRK